MSAQIITNIISTESLRIDLLKLVSRQYELEEAIAAYNEDLKDIQLNARAMGLKPAEFKLICKYLRPHAVDLLHNEQETLDNILTLRDFMKDKNV